MNKPRLRRFVGLAALLLAALPTHILGAAEPAPAAAEEPEIKTPQAEDYDGSVTVMSLPDCLGYAAGHSLELKKQVLTAASQKLNTAIERGAFAWVLEAGASRNAATAAGSASSLGGNLTLKRKLTSGFALEAGLSATDYWNYDVDSTAKLSVGISKVILGGGGTLETRFNLDNSLIDEVITLNQANRYRRELVYRVKTIYYAIIRDKQTLKVKELQLKRARQNLEHARERERPLDIATAEIEVPENEVAVLRAKIVIQSALDELKEMLGMEMPARININAEFSFRVETVDAASDIRLCFVNDEELLNAGLSRQKAEREAEMLRAKVRPEVRLYAKSSRDTDSGLDLGDGDSDHQVGMALSWTLGRQSDEARYLKALNGVEKAELNISLLKLGKERDVRTLARKLDEAASLIKLQEERVKIGTRRAALYADRWENGEIDILEYIRAQNDLENNRIELISLKTNYMELLGQYRFTIGREDNGE